MNLSVSISLGAALLLGVTALVNPAHADVIYQSATAGNAGNIPPDGGFVVQGDGTTGGSNVLGGVFTVTGLTRVTDIGGNFLVSNSSSGGGAIFGEIVKVSAGASFPAQSIEQLSPIARATFAPTVDGDNSVALTAVLGAGTYALLFGGNTNTDAPGFATLADHNTQVGAPSLFQDNFGAAGGPWDNGAPADTRIFVDGVAVSEPASVSVLGAALLMLGLRARRRG